jgi:peptidoglycan biosynthesis protein MviN/MurJ (putative lipid II flippase)
MSTPSITIDAPVSVPSADASRHKARAGMAMSIATFVMAAASGLQAVLYLSRFGTNARTDGFFVAFAVYTTFGVFSQTLRVTTVPLLVGPRARLTIRQFAAALGLLAVPVLLATSALAGPVSHVIAPGLGHAGRSVTAAALPLLGIAMTLQLWAAGAATVLAVRDRFAPVAAAYIGGAVAGLAVFLGVMHRAGVQTLGWSMMAMSVVTCVMMLGAIATTGGLGTETRSLRPKPLLRATGLVLGGTPIYLAFNMLFVISLAFASHGAAGDSTVLSYAYLFASYLVAGTGTALGMSRIPELTRRARFEGPTLLRETVPQGFRYSILLVAPAMAGLIAAGAPLVHALLPGSLTNADVHILRGFAALLAPWMVVALIVNFLIPVLLATGRSALLNKLALPLLVVHVAATALGSVLFGVYGAVGAITVAPACLAVALLVTGGQEGTRAVSQTLARDTGAFAGLAAVAFGLAWALSSPLASAGAAAFSAAVIGALVYIAGLRLVARREVNVVLGAVAARRGAAT